MKSLCFLFFHSYLNYENIARCSTAMTKIRKLYSKQRKVIKALSMTSEDYSVLKIEDMMKKQVSLTLYIYHMINLMFRVNTIPEVFENKFKIGRHNYPKRHSKNNLAEHKIYFKATKFAISSCTPCLWNSLTNKDTKTIMYTMSLEQPYR